MNASINITVTDSGVKCDTELSVPELVFWLETVKTMVLEDFLSEEDTPNE